MSLFDKVSDLTRTAAKKSTEVLEATRTSLRINEEKAKIKDLEVELGKFYYQKYAEGAQLDPEAMKKCDQIKSIYAVLDELEVPQKSSGQTTVADQSAKGAKFCPHCGASQSEDAKFCGSCGGKLGE